MKLSEVKTGIGEPTTFLWVGATGTRKTTSIGSFPGRTYIFDFDNRIEPLAVHFKNRDDIEFDFYPSNKMPAFKQKIESFVNGDCPFDNIVFDSFTFLARNAVSWMIKSRARDGKVLGGWRVSDVEDYGGETSVIVHLLDAVAILNDQKKKNIIVTAHFVTPEDPMLVSRLVTGGKSIAEVVPGAFNEVYHFFIDKDLDGTARYKVRTRGTQRYPAKTTYLEVPDVIDITNKPLFEAINSYKK